MRNQSEALEIGGDAAGRSSPLWILYPLVLAAAVSTLYIATLMPGVGGETDTAKWQFVGKVWGVPHTTGYPLYVSLNHLFSHLPFGTLAWRINFMSAFFAVLAVVVLQRILANLLKSELIAFAGALLLAVLPLFWTFAVVAGVYSLNAFFICLIVYFLFKWADGNARKSGAGKMKFFYAACAVYALSFGNHVTMITMLPAFVLFALATDRRAVLKPGTLLILFAFIVVAALQYSIPFIQTAAESPYLENRVSSFEDLRNLLTATGFRQHMFSGGVEGFFDSQLSDYLGFIVFEFTFLVFPLAAGGLFVLFRERRRHCLFLLVFLAVNLLVTLNYYVLQVRYQWIPSYIIIAMFIAASVGLIRVIAPHPGRAASAAASVCCSVIILLMAGYVMLANLPRIQAKRDKAMTRDKLADDIIDSLPPGGVMLASNYDDSMLLLYKMLGEERGREKHWRVWHDTSWKAANAEAVGGLLRGEKIFWGPLVVQDEYRGNHEIFFSAADKRLLDAAGFKSEPVDLPGDGGGKNIYGGKQVRIYKITAPPHH
ncbi:MAG: DUF2723 domain-containing protein [Planctomycetota bacterium]